MNVGDIVVSKRMYERNNLSMPAVVASIDNGTAMVNYCRPNGQLAEGFASVQSLIVLESANEPR